MRVICREQIQSLKRVDPSPAAGASALVASRLFDAISIHSQRINP
jgi:hypothetical protein